TGTLTFYDGPSTFSPQLGTVAYAGGTASFTMSNLALGSHTMTVGFTDTDGNNANGAPISLAYTVTPATTGVSFVAESPSNPVYGQAVTFTVSVVPNPSISPALGTPAGNVILSYGATPATQPTDPGYLGTGAINVGTQHAIITTAANALPGGTLTINAYY